MTVTRPFDWQVSRSCGTRQLVTLVRMGSNTAVLQAQAALQANFMGPLGSRASVSPPVRWALQ